ncbi:MAG: hypothetical protein JSU90_09600 [Nitrospiraceae bacterium]|nr:MAG: hypothetical protein JSU90_09600 [Nitrospiraceae bacterium]
MTIDEAPDKLNCPGIAKVSRDDKERHRMTMTKKMALFLIIAGICLPTATLPLISEFRPVPELCLTSNFFQNMGNMMVVLGRSGAGIETFTAGSGQAPLAIPYRYLFSAGVLLACSGLGLLVIASGKSRP